MAGIDKKKNIVAVLAALLFVLAFLPYNAFADSVNSAESRVYSAACGTFTYDGKVYRAYGNYLSQVYSYLSRDDVDLSDSEATAKIHAMRVASSVRTAVRSGYLYQIGTVSGDSGSSSGDTGTSSSDSGTTASDSGTTEYFDDSADSGTPYKNETAYKNSELYKLNKDKIDAANSVLLDSSSADSVAKKQEDTAQAVYNNILKKRVSKKETSVTVSVDPDTGKADISKTSASGSAATFVGEIGFLDSHLQQVRFVFMAIEVLLLVLAVGAAVVLARNRCFSFQKKKDQTAGSDHAKRRKIRRMFGVFFTVALAFNTFVACAAVSGKITLFSNNQITVLMSETGYYHAAYKELNSNMQELLEQEGCMANACEDAVSYDAFLFDIKNQMLRQLDGKLAVTDYSDVREAAQTEMEASGYISNSDAKKISKEIESLYSSSVKSVVGISVRHARQAYDGIMMPGLLLAFVDIVLMILLLLFIERYRHRGVRRIFSGVLAGVIAFGVCLLYLVISKPYASIYITPDYLYVFFNGFMKRFLKICTAVFISGAVISILLKISAMFMRKSLEED